MILLSRVLFILFFAMALTLPVVAADSERAELYASFTSRKYMLGPNDIINVSVLGLPEFDQDAVRVKPDGKINISGLGSVNAAGLTLEALQDVLNERYAFYIKYPNVSVKLERSRPFIVHVTGAVAIPGSYEINTDTSTTTSSFSDGNTTFVERKTPILSNIISTAGGLNYDADLEHIMVNNKFDGTSYQVNLLEVLEDGKTSQDIYLMAGDTVHVPKLHTPLAVDPVKYTKFAKSTFAYRNVPVRVIGYVNNPGLHELDASISSTLNTAIAQAGGYMGDAPYPPKKVFVSRYSDGGKLVTTTVDPMQKDLTLMPNDVVYVPEKARPLVGRAFDYITRIVSPISTVASGYNHWSLMFDPSRFNDVP